jgi:glycosyltransferase involved in cell wall biosynthesis
MVEQKSTIEILLSTYNGEKYIETLLESLLLQTYNNWRLLVRDDGSIDNTVSIVKRYLEKYPDKIMFYEDNSFNLGPSQSFSTLLGYSKADYIMFCDQDDVWLPEKISVTFNKMIELESKSGDLPCLIHTDLYVVNQNLQVVSNSFWKYQKLNPKMNKFRDILIQNNVTGCTVMLNRRLKELSLPIPKDAIMHDWWLALVAAAFGWIDYVSSPTIYYRQHFSNSVGAKKYSFVKLINKFLECEDKPKVFEPTIRQSEKFLIYYKSKIGLVELNFILNFITILEQKKLTRVFRLFKYKYKKYGFLRNIGFLYYVLFSK